MNCGRTVFSQLVQHLPEKEFQKCVARHQGDSNFRGFSCWDQLLAMAFAQLTYRESLRDIESCLRALQSKLYHMGFRGKVSRSTLADANESHDWRIFADFAQVLITIARPLHACDLMGVDLDQSLYALDSTKSNVLLQRRYSHPVDKSTGVLSDQTVILSSLQSATAYPDTLRKVSYFDAERSKRLKFLTNNFTLPARTIADLYRQRWQVELFFKWIKQHLRIKAFYGTSENAVKTQIWIAVSIYVLVAIVRKRLKLEASLYQILQILSVTLFEKTPILRALQNSNSQSDLLDYANQFILFDL
jgi:hypothetical protein